MRNIGTYKNFHFDGILNENDISGTNLAADAAKVKTNKSANAEATIDAEGAYKRSLVNANNAKDNLLAVRKAAGSQPSFFLEEREFDDEDLDDEYDDIDPLDDGDGDPNTDLDINMFGDDLDDEDELLDNAEFPNYEPEKKDILNEKEPKQEVKSFFD